MPASLAYSFQRLAAAQSLAVARSYRDMATIRHQPGLRKTGQRQV